MSQRFQGTEASISQAAIAFSQTEKERISKSGDLEQWLREQN